MERKLARFPSLTQPIFEGGRIAGEIESAEAGERENTAILRLRLENRVDLHLALGGDFSAGK